MTLRLSSSQKTILIAAGGRPDGNLLPIPDTVMLRGKSVGRTLASLIRRGFALEATADHATTGSSNSDDERPRVLCHHAGRPRRHLPGLVRRRR